ncbi:ATP-dependent DNA helicase [Marinicauda salina]|uniref:ATP-dependent DNA helicase n=1 Tax=Marinicauda salina TaxID=2135793 RepID=UPI0022B9050A|nr:DEAD/DEAH box helicase [Marinicauda salina]
MTADPLPQLSASQADLVEYIAGSGANVFLTGKAGSGKTTVTRALIARMGRDAAVLAPTGVAAMNAGGMTLHAFFRLPPRLVTPDDVRRVRGGKAMKALKTLIIDEISMVRADVMAAIDRSLRINRGVDAPFGGVQMVLAGDLAQLPPIVRGEEAAWLEESFGGPFFFHPPVFRDAGFTMIELEEIHRQADPEFVEILNAVREGRITREQGALLNTRVTGRNGLEASETHVVLTATNDVANRINAARLDALVGEPRAFAGKVEGSFEEKVFPTDDPLVLKAGARVMMIRNDPGGRWVNGSLGEVVGFTGDGVEVAVGGEVHTVEPAKWERFRYGFDAKAETLKKETVGAFTQYPLRLAWAMTIHKAQGLTLDRVYLDVSRRLFAHGQAYVALSRARSLEGLEISRPLTPRDVIIDERVFDVRSFCDHAPPALLG